MLRILNTKFLTIILSIGIILAAIFGIVLSEPSENRHNLFYERNLELEAQIAELKKQINERNTYEKYIKEDSWFRKHIIRKELGYLEEGWIIIKFEDTSATDNSSL